MPTKPRISAGWPAAECVQCGIGFAAKIALRHNYVCPFCGGRIESLSWLKNNNSNAWLEPGQVVHPKPGDTDDTQTEDDDAE